MPKSEEKFESKSLNSPEEVRTKDHGRVTGNSEVIPLAW
jgi:hypothetical protein